MAVKENDTNEARGNPPAAKHTACLPLTSAGVKPDPEFTGIFRKCNILQSRLSE